MKTSNKTTIVTGVALLLVAALFSISLILQGLDFGLTEAGQKNMFYMLGNILYSVYGFSSILIPVFLFISGLSCFASKWSARKTMRLLTAIVPFFTAVITENICRSILALEHSGFPGVKVFVAVVTGVMLIIIEFLGAGIIADKLNPILFGNKNKADKAESDSTKRLVQKPLPQLKKNPQPQNDAEAAAEKIVADATGSESGLAAGADQTPAQENPLAQLNQIGKLNTDSLIFGKNKAGDTESSEVSAMSVAKMSSENFENKVEPDDGDGSSDEVNDEVKSQISSVFDKALSEVKTDVIEDIEPVDSDEEIGEIEEIGAVDSIPEPEEEIEPEADDYAEPGASIITEEEYAALTDFGDDEPVEEEEPEDELEWNNLPPKQDTLPPDYIDEDDPALEFPPKDEEASPASESSPAAASEDDPFSAFDVNLDENADSEPETPYSSKKYIDSVVENPNFGHGITLREGEAAEEETEEKKTSEPQKPVYPSRINLGQQEEQAENQPDSCPVPPVRQAAPAPVAEPSSPLASPSSEAIQHAAEKSSMLYAASHKENDDAFGTSDVFAQMEDDIRKESLKKISEETERAYQNGELKTEEAAPEVATSFAEAAVPEAPGAIAQDPDFIEANFVDEEPVSGANDLTANGEDEIAAMEDDSDHDEIYDDESVAFSDDVNGDYKESDAFAHEDDELELEEEPEPERAQIMPNPPKIGNRATKKGPYVIPSDLLTAYKDDQYWIIDDATKESALNLTNTLAEFNIEAKVINIKKGPVVTMFEILPAPGVRLQKIVALQDNIALSLAAQSVRIVAPIPGKQAVGIEVPNRHRSIVGFREIIEMKLDEWDKMAVPVVLGKDILGKAQLIDLVKTPHMLIAGATGSGKSVCVNSLILSILYKRSYRDVKLILVDPKVVELKLYNNIPHLLVPVITEPKKALQALQWCLCEMERRYALLDSMGVRDISTYNQRIKERDIATEKLPYIVVIIDEFADLMATSGRELESTVARLTAMSRAVGIHLVLATQRPSVNVITGLIKANIPSRIAFMVSSRTDSNIIIDSVGAEKLLGRGDMLYASAVDPAPVRIQGTFISDQEVENVVNAVKEYGEPDYIDDQVFFEDEDEDEEFELNGNYDGDPLYDQALEIVIQSGKASASYLQRRLSIGYNRAARLVEEMEERGIVGPANGSKPREILHVPG